MPSSRRHEVESPAPIFGLQPSVLLEHVEENVNTTAGRTTSDHIALDQRAQAMASAIADRIQQDPSLVERARKFIRRQLARASAGERKELEEWSTILESMTGPRLQRFLVEKSERANRLRQTLPFVDVLSSQGRLDILDAWRARMNSDDV